ncbi:olfactomedin-4-like [Fundulus heteroclitus]|uniref:olfactomedin-4-like n=1 Tax=Fundulus heteroclitus TaxID=8078 RepID=UPI00165C4360|nr:olfactomedin-4-like [Fundulus heteroclitus]
MKLSAIVPLWALLSLTQQAAPLEKCSCDLNLEEKAFPHDKLQTVEGNATDCKTHVTPEKALELESLLMGLEKRLTQLHNDVTILENEDDGELYGVLSLFVIENEMVEIRQLMDKLNRTTLEYQVLTADTIQQLEDLKTEMTKLEKFDTMEVVKGRKVNRQLKIALEKCKSGVNTNVAPTQELYGTCERGPLRKVTGPVVNTKGEFSGDYPYGAWGRDPKPEAGKDRWYWVVPLTSSQYANYVRFYSSLNALVFGVNNPESRMHNSGGGPDDEDGEWLEEEDGEELLQWRGPGNIQISPSNPATNTIQGPNNVLYGGALYYNCYNQDAVCRFNLTTKTVTNVKLPKGTRYNSKSNFCHLENCFLFTDLDMITDESGVWVVYTTTQALGNLVLSKVEETEPPSLSKTWTTSVYKRSVSNTFMACGVLYATRYIDTNMEEVFYSFDTTTGMENFKVGIFINKVSPNIYSLNYSPVDQMLYVYSDAKMVSYKALFG